MLHWFFQHRPASSLSGMATKQLVGRRTAAGRRVAARKAASPLVRVFRSAERHASSTCPHMLRRVTLPRTPGGYIRAVSIIKSSEVGFCL